MYNEVHTERAAFDMLASFDDEVLACLLVQFENLVDPASSHMLVLKIKPCTLLYK